MKPTPNRPSFASPYRAGQVVFTYRSRFFVMPPKPPAAPEILPTNIPAATHELVTAAAGVVAEKWEKFAGWIIAAFGAIAGLSVSNYEKVIQMTSAHAVKTVLVLFFIAVVLHALQKLFATFVQAGVAGGKVGKDMNLQLKVSELQPFLHSVAGVYPWPVSKWIKNRFDKMVTEGVTYVCGVMIRAALWSALFAAGQLLLGLIAICVIGFALHDPTP
jgi:hypothetical protein